MPTFHTDDDSGEAKSRWNILMNETRRRFAEVWEGVGKLPDRDENG